MAPEPGAPLGRRAIRSVGWVALDKWGARLTSLVVFAILGRLLAPADFGVVALATVFLAFLSVLVDIGFSQALVQRENLDDAHTHTAFWISLGLGVALGLALFLAATAAGALGSDSDLVPVLQVLSLALPLAALSSVPVALLTREFGFRALAIRRLVATAIGAVVAVWLAAAGAGVWALVAQNLSTSAIGLLVLWRVTPWRPSRRFSRQAARDLLNFGVAVFGIEMIAQANAHVDKLLVGLFLGHAELGYYFVGSRISLTMMDMFVAVIGSLSLPTFSRMQDDLPRMVRALQQLTFVSAAITFPVFALAAALAPEMIALLFGGQWDASVPIMQWLAPAAALTTISWFDKGLFLGAGHTKVAFRLSAADTVLGLALLAAALPFGAAAVAGSRSLRRALFWPFRLRALRRWIGVETWPYVKQFATPAAAAVMAAGVVWAWQHAAWAIESDIAAILTLGTAGTLLYLGTLTLLAGAEVRRTFSAVLGSRTPAWLSGAA
jgi:PST family polysaccharide transporter